MSAVALPNCGAFGRGQRHTDPNAQPLRDVAELVGGMQYGEVRLVVTGGKITQVDTTDRKRYGNQRENEK